MKNQDLQEKAAEISRHDERYAVESYEFIARAVEFAVGNCTKPEAALPARHVSARQLLEQIVIFAGHEFGPFAESVLRGWGINTAADIGNIVYNLIRVNALSASKDDSPNDFNIEYDLFAGSRHAGELKSDSNPEVPVIA